MTVWAFNKPGEEAAIDFIYESIQKGKSRFGWSYQDSFDLRILDKKESKECSEEELKIWTQTKFLLDIQKGDWIIHINVPKWGFCSAVKVDGSYEFDNKKNEFGNSNVGDFKHMVCIDPKSLIEFDRDDKNVPPELNKRLKLQGKKWRIKCENEFLDTILKLKKVDVEHNKNKQVVNGNIIKTKGIIFNAEHRIEWSNHNVSGIKQDWLSQKKFKEKYKNAKIIGDNGSYQIIQNTCNKFFISVKLDNLEEIELDITSLILEHKSWGFISKENGEKCKKELINKKVELLKNIEHKKFHIAKDFLNH